jgi:acetyl-CoA acetyltransferase
MKGMASAFNGFVTRSSLPRQVAIVGAQGLVRRGSKENVSSTSDMIGQVLSQALAEAHLTKEDLDGVVAVPSLAKNHFMESHYHATSLGLFHSQRPPRRHRPLRCRTIDTGGAGPVSALLEAKRMILKESSPLECVAIIAADAVGSMDSSEFLRRADAIFFQLASDMSWPPTWVVSPAIPNGYCKITQFQLDEYPETFHRRHLQMCVSLESFHANMHPDSLQSNTRSSLTSLEEVMKSPAITNNISLLECARRADGAACLILASNRFLQRKGLWREGLPVVIGSGESSGPLYPPPEGISNYTYASCQEAMTNAFLSAGNLNHEDIDFFGLYDCFPICLIRAIEACGLAEEGRGGLYVEKAYHRMMAALSDTDESTKQQLLCDPGWFPINCHGGLLCFGAPWEVPAMYNIIEAVQQLQGKAKGRQLRNVRRALVYGNGGVLSASAVAILAKTTT